MPRNLPPPHAFRKNILRTEITYCYTLTSQSSSRLSKFLTGMAGASSQVFFEGTEKLLEVWFSSDSESPDLRDVKQLVSANFFSALALHIHV